MSAYIQARLKCYEILRTECDRFFNSLSEYSTSRNGIIFKCTTARTGSEDGKLASSQVLCRKSTVFVRAPGHFRICPIAGMRQSGRWHMI